MTVLSQLVVPAGLAAGVGVILGAAGSVLASPLLPWGLARRAEPEPGIRVDAYVLVWGLLGCAAVLAIAVAAVCTMVMRRERRGVRSSARGSTVAAVVARMGVPVVVESGLRLAFGSGPRGRGARRCGPPPERPPLA